MTNSIDTSEGTLSLTGNQYTIQNLTFDPTFSVTVPSGNGEHEDSDDPNSADGTHGPSEAHHHYQEAITDTFPGCRLHVYLVPATYTFSGELTIVTNGNQIDVNVSKLRPGSAVQYDPNGCADLAKITAALVGGIAGAVVGGPVGAAAGVAVGYVAGQGVVDRVNQLIGVAIYNKITTYNGSWHIRT